MTHENSTHACTLIFEKQHFLLLSYILPARSSEAAKGLLGDRTGNHSYACSYLQLCEATFVLSSVASNYYT